jgi:ArsR family transcriptional regulator
MNQVDIFKALGDETRIRIVSLLLKGELCVCEIEEILGISQTNASRHLSKLRTCGVISSAKKAQWVYYKLNGDFIKERPLLAEYLGTEVKKIESCRLDSVKLKRFRNKKTSAGSLQCEQS